MHGNVKDSEESKWAEYISRSIDAIATSEGKCLQDHDSKIDWKKERKKQVDDANSSELMVLHRILLGSCNRTCRESEMVRTTHSTYCC